MRVIESDIPLPSQHVRAGVARPGLGPSGNGVTRDLRALDIGQSFFIQPGETTRIGLKSTVYQLRKRIGQETKRFSVRAVDGGFRVWRWA